MTRFKTLAAALACALAATAAEPFALRYSATAELNGGPGNFAPYYIASQRQGKITSARGAMLDLYLWKPIDLSRRFSYAFGVEGILRGGNNVDYERFDKAAGSLVTCPERTSNVWLHQLYGTVKFRGVYLTVGLEEQKSALLNRSLSSGDLIESGNSRPMPGARAGFINFQNIPLTNGWVQIQGEIAYAKSTDNAWQRNHFNYYNYHINQGWWYNYKRMLFRTKPSQPFSITIGLQAAAQFSGYTYSYNKGVENPKVLGSPLKFMDFVHMIVLERGDEYVTGNHLGAWDFQARYRLPDRSDIKAYFQWLWEDGSGIGKLNAMDGLWGLEWDANRRGPVRAALIEVLTFMHQGGPLHYDPADHPGTTLTQWHATGGDNYYNNGWFNGYAYYGQAIGSPMFPSPVYNVDGFTTMFTQNRFWGIHAAVEGDITSALSYRVKANYRRYFGTIFVPDFNPTHSFSAFAEAVWRPDAVKGLTLGGQMAFDAGNSIYGRTFGVLLSASYSGIFDFKQHKHTPCAL